MSEHKLATAADFRNDVNEADCYEPAREILLPKSQKWVLLRRPKPLAYTLLGAPLPGIAEEPDTAGPTSEGAAKMAAEEFAQFAGWLTRLWGKVFVQPKLSLRPGPDEIHPDWIGVEDQRFIWQWIRSEVNDSGESMSHSFPNAQG